MDKQRANRKDKLSREQMLGDFKQGGVIEKPKKMKRGGLASKNNPHTSYLSPKMATITPGVKNGRRS